MICVQTLQYSSPLWSKDFLFPVVTFLSFGWFNIGLAKKGSFRHGRVGREDRLGRRCVGMMRVGKVGIIYIARIVALDTAI